MTTKSTDEVPERSTSGVSEARDVIDGAAVVARQAATLTLPFDPTRSFVSKVVEEVLLDDGRTVYQCNQTDRATSGPCNYWSELAQSVNSHTKIHAPAHQLKARDAELAELQADYERVKAELEERVRRRSEGSKRAAATRKQKANGSQPKDTSAPPTESATPEVAGVRRPTPTASKIGKTQRLAGDIEHEINVLIFDTQRIGAELAQVVDGLTKISERVAKMQAVDPEVVAKAEAYDALRKLMNK